MGLVRRVRDPVLDRIMALKILRPELQGDASALARFEAEARLMARLQHPGIVPISALGRLEDGRLGLVMQEVRGRTFTAPRGRARRDHGGSAAEIAAHAALRSRPS